MINCPNCQIPLHSRMHPTSGRDWFCEKCIFEVEAPDDISEERLADALKDLQ